MCTFPQMTTGIFSGRAPQFAATIGTQFTPAYIVSQDIDDIGFLAKASLKGGQFFVDGLVFFFQMSPCTSNACVAGPSG